MRSDEEVLLSRGAFKFSSSTLEPEPPESGELFEIFHINPVWRVALLDRHVCQNSEPCFLESSP